jgi:hypothetical protein
VRLLLALFLPALFIALPAAGASPLGLATALTTGLAAALVVAVVLPVRLEQPVLGRAISLRGRAKLAVFLRLRDPDAPGRTRPRAPGLGIAAA